MGVKWKSSAVASARWLRCSEGVVAALQLSAEARLNQSKEKSYA